MTDDEAPSALVQEVDSTDRLLVLKVRVPGRSSWILAAATRGGGEVALLEGDDRKRAWGGRLPGGAPRMKAREESLVGARVLALGAREILIDQKGTLRRIVAERARVVVSDVDGGATRELTPFIDASDEARARWLARGRELINEVATLALDQRRDELRGAIEKGAKRIERRAEAVRGDLAKIHEAGALAAQAQWLVAEAKRAPRGARELVVTDWSTGEAVPMRVALDPAKGASEQVAAMFKRAKRLRLGARVAEERLAVVEKNLAALCDLKARLTTSESLEEIEGLGREAKRVAPRDVTLPGAATRGASATGKDRLGLGRRVAYRTFLAQSGRRLLVGKGAADNDDLTLHVARPFDLWVHAKERTGAHVIAVLEKGKTCPSEDLVDAAHLAAHFSDARDETVVDVQYAERRYIRKPKGSPPGFVVVEREKVLVLRVDAATTKELLEREEVT